MELDSRLTPRASQNSVSPSETAPPERSPVLIFEWDYPNAAWIHNAVGATVPENTTIPLRWFGSIDEHLGYESGEFPRTFEAWAQALHPDDRVQVLEALENHLRSGEPYFIACRLRCRDGSWLECTHSGISARDERGAIIKFTALHANLVSAKAHLTDARQNAAAARAESLLRTAARLNAQLELADVCEAICAEAARTIGAPSAVMLFNPARDAFVPQATINMPPDYATRYTPTMRAIYERHVAEMGPLFLFTDAQATPDLPNHALYREVDMRTIGIASLIREGEVLGLLKVYSFGTSRHFNEDELALLQGLADLAAQAIANARLYEQARRRLADIAALRQIDRAILGSSDVQVALSVVLDQVVSRLDCDAAAVSLLNRHTRTLAHAADRGFRTQTVRREQWRLGESLAGRAALERRVIYIADVNVAPEAEPEWERELEAIQNARTIYDEGFVSHYVVPLVAAGQVKGVLNVWHRTPLRLEDEALEFLNTLAGQTAIAIDNATLFADLQRSNDELALAYDSTLEGWSRALDLRDKETEGHSRRVTEMSVRLAQAMGLTDAELVQVRRGALLHDIGKMGVPDAILLKPGPLNDDEWLVMKQHPVYAYELLAPIGFLRPALDIPYGHHEKWDGSGYPRGLKAEQIPLAARIFAVVDVWDALRSDRPYRQGWPRDRVLEHINAGSGSHFDPRVVDAFVQMQAEIAE